MAEKEKTKKNKEEKIELEREYIVPLRKEWLKVPRYKRAKKALKALKEFLAKHMKVEERDIKKVKIDIYLNNEIWFRGIKKPPAKIKVKAVKKNGIVYAELAEPPKVVEFIKKKMEKREKKIKGIKHKKEEKKEKKEEQDIEEKEKEKASVEAGLEKQKQEARIEKHSTKIKPPAQSQIHRKALKR